MYKTTTDSAFGAMKFDYGWCKEEDISFFGKTITVEVLAEAEVGQPISDIQRNLYTRFCNEIKTLSATALEALRAYYSENHPFIIMQMDFPGKLPEPDRITDIDLINMVIPKTVFFPQDNLYAILCDSPWEPQEGLAIIICDDAVSIGIQSEVL
ncbi:DUF6985 domain-containing protein [Pontiella sulfatireligans]|uniref:DUF6985 domain-containing protein n=1 Tax=Pontiella sulfatireligans TaxID=2750658 RepID=A0A6C2UTG2_9BACT|nr:hypothetical protein [Pontiella sulfatireligans]VGO22196.1 hypothetical protein SCARR_04278 [Pontiella sulfatireligans]